MNKPKRNSKKPELAIELYLRDKFCNLFKELRMDGLGNFYFAKDKKTDKEFHLSKNCVFYKIKNTKNKSFIVTGKGENAYRAKENLWCNFNKCSKKMSGKKKIFNISEKQISSEIPIYEHHLKTGAFY